MNTGETYLDIVWRQFQKNRAAYWALWMMVPVFLLAIFAPAIASSQPVVFHDASETDYPWFRALFNPDEVSDFIFNMALVGFVPWTLLALSLNHVAKRREVPGRRRLGLALLLYTVIIALFSAVFAWPQVRPRNQYLTRNFAREEFQSHGSKRGIYTPIPFGPIEVDGESIFKPPGYTKDPALWEKVSDRFPHALGTDNIGHDVLAQMIYGTRISMTVGFVAVGIYVTIGVIVGALAGYFGGKLDMLVSRVIEIVLLFPSFFLILTLVALLGQSIYIIMVVIGVTGWPTIARLIRGEVLKQRSIDYTMAARALGSSNLRIVFRHILPNAISPALVAAPFGIASAVITEAGLSLLGFGVRPPTPSWGSLLHWGNGNYHYWWLIVVPSIAIFVTVTLFNLVGSGLRDAMDPKLRK